MGSAVNRLSGEQRVSARRPNRSSLQSDVHVSPGQDLEDLGEKVAGLAVRCQDLGQVCAGGRGVAPEQGYGGGVAEGPAQAVVEGGDLAPGEAVNGPGGYVPYLQGGFPQSPGRLFPAPAPAGCPSATLL